MNRHLQRPHGMLDRTCLDMLAAEAGTTSSPLPRADNRHAPIGRLIGELAVTPASESRTAIRVDLTAAEIPVAGVIEPIEGLTRELRRGSQVSLATLGADARDQTP